MLASPGWYHKQLRTWRCVRCNSAHSSVSSSAATAYALTSLVKHQQTHAVATAKQLPSLLYTAPKQLGPLPTHTGQHWLQYFHLALVANCLPLPATARAGSAAAAAWAAYTNSTAAVFQPDTHTHTRTRTTHAIPHKYHTHAHLRPKSQTRAMRNAAVSTAAELRE